jgi:hypothetical protein
MKAKRASAMRSARPPVQHAWVVALSALLACDHVHAGEPALVGDTDPSTTLVLTGAIDQPMVERFNAAVAEGDIRTVRISSHEGQPAPALQIAEAIATRNIDVEVRGICVGACTYILIAGQKRRIEEDSLVAFRLSGTGLASLGSLLGEDFPADFTPGLQIARELAASEDRLFQQRGVSTSLLLDSQMALQPQCVIFHRDLEGKASGWSLNRMTYVLWVPTRKQLTAAGLAFEGYWPRSRREMARLAVRIIQPAGREQLIRFGSEDHLRRQRGRKYAYEEIKNCALEQEAAVDPAAASATPSI